MAARRLLFLDAAHLTAYLWQLAGPREEARFPTGEAGCTAFGAYLRQHSASLFYLLADVADEGFQVEDIPHVQGSDRQEIVKRKLAQYFYGSPLTLAISRGRLKEGRRDERLLLAGLTGYGIFEPWLLAMREAESRLAGVYSLPQVIAGLLAKEASNDSMLVMSVSPAGVRQTFLDKGQLRFSRLTPMATGNGAEVAATCAVETSKIYQYLAGQRLIARDAPLRTLLLAHPAQFDTFRAACQDTRERQVELLDILTLAKQHGLAVPPSGSSAETLFLHFLARHRPVHQFAPDADRHFFRLWQLRSAIQVAASAMLAGGLLFGGGQAYFLNNLASGNRELQDEIAVGQQRYERALQALPKIALSPDQLRALTDRQALLERRSPGLAPLLQHISQALAQTPKVELTKLDWRIAGSADDDSAGHVRAATPAAAVPAGAADSYAIVVLSGQLPLAMASDHRAQMATVNTLVAALTGATVRVQVVSLPFETESGKSIRSDDLATHTAAPAFQLRLVQKL
jgi:hypothetical protein